MWIALFILLTVLFSTIIYVLVAPVVIEIDTLNNLYRLRFFRIAHGRFYFNGIDPWVEIKIAWWHKKYNLLTALKNIPTDSPKTIVESPEKNTEGRSIPWRKLLPILRSFKVEKFSWHLDTGDFALNGELYGLFGWYRYTWGHDVTINFNGNNYLALTVKNSAWRVLRAILKTNKTLTK
jgi:hypothetical protein